MISGCGSFGAPPVGVGIRSMDISAYLMNSSTSPKHHVMLQPVKCRSGAQYRPPTFGSANVASLISCKPLVDWNLSPASLIQGSASALLWCFCFSESELSRLSSSSVSSTKATDWSRSSVLLSNVFWNESITSFDLGFLREREMISFELALFLTYALDRGRIKHLSRCSCHIRLNYDAHFRQQWYTLASTKKLNRINKHILLLHPIGSPLISAVQ